MFRECSSLKNIQSIPFHKKILLPSQIDFVCLQRVAYSCTAHLLFHLSIHLSYLLCASKLSHNDQHQVLHYIYSGFCDSSLYGGVIAIYLILLNISCVHNSYYISHAIFTKLPQNDHYQAQQHLYYSFHNSIRSWLELELLWSPCVQHAASIFTFK